MWPLGDNSIPITRVLVSTSTPSSLANLAMDQIELGELGAAEANLRRGIDLCREIKDEFWEAVGHQFMGRLLAYEGRSMESDEHLTTAQAVFDERGPERTSFVSSVRAFRALRALLMGEPEAALEAARQARALADEVATTLFPMERDIIEAEWLLGAALVALASEQPRRRANLLSEAEAHLTEALTHCRCINMVDTEPDILLAWARWHYAQGNAQEAHGHAREALAIADRCEYRLNQADIHNFLARLALEEGDRPAASQHATAAYERDSCDGPPHCYKPALEEAERLLSELGAPPPRLKPKATP
jgi:tetratricopeptide (TPR) repeat protein